MTSPDAPACDKPASRIIFRGKTRRLFLCADCPYEGSGKVAPYERDHDGEKTRGTFYGEPRICGETVGDE